MKNLYHNQKATVRTEVGETEEFGIGKGVRQGCILSPYLFNFYSEYIIRKAELNNTDIGIRIGGERVNNIRYADDTTLIAETKEDLIKLLNAIKRERVPELVCC